jgi:hypothetical protein
MCNMWASIAPWRKETNLEQNVTFDSWSTIMINILSYCKQQQLLSFPKWYLGGSYSEHSLATLKLVDFVRVSDSSRLQWKLWDGGCPKGENEYKEG